MKIMKVSSTLYIYRNSSYEIINLVHRINGADVYIIDSTDLPLISSRNLRQFEVLQQSVNLYLEKIRKYLESIYSQLWRRKLRVASLQNQKHCCNDERHRCATTMGAR